MKNPLIKLLGALCAIVAVTLMMTSCGDPDDYDLQNVEQMKKAGEIVKEWITEDMQLTRINFKNSDSKSFNFRVDEANIVYVDPEDPKKLAGLNIDLKTGEATTDEFYSSKPAGMRANKGSSLPADFDFAAIATAVNAGLALAAEEEYTIDGIGTYSIIFYGGNTEATMNFSMRHITGTTRTGRIKRTSYEEVNISTNLQGEIKHK